MALLPAHVIVFLNARRANDAAKMRSANGTSFFLITLASGILIWHARKQSLFLTQMSIKYVDDLPDDDLRAIQSQIRAPDTAQERAIVS